MWIKSNRQQHNSHGISRVFQRAVSNRSWRFGALLALALCLWSCWPTLAQAQPNAPDSTAPIIQEIRYRSSEAGEVFLVWGVNDWAALPENQRPPGTVLKDHLMYTPLSREGDTFVIRVPVPAGTTIDYVFQITKTRDGAAADFWETNIPPLKDYHLVAAEGQVTVVQAKLAADQTAVEDTPMTTEIRYDLAEAGEVFMLWGVDGWAALPKDQQPAGTVLRDAIMYTPMSTKNGAFVLDLQVSPGTALDYIFHITKKRDGAGVDVWDSGNAKSYRAIAAPNVGIEIKTGQSLTEVKVLPSMGSVQLDLIMAALITIVLGSLLLWVPPDANRRVFIAILCGLILLGLALRLWVAWNTNQQLPDTSARLAGDETGYDYLGYALLQGRFFDWPGRTPVYPLFLAVCYWLFGHSYAMVVYIQAFVGVTTIPLTYQLARRFTGVRSALFAAGLVALHPALIQQVSRLYTEVLYTPLLLLVLLTLLWALEAPLSRRFAALGLMIALLTLCRPTTILLPAIIPLLLPHTWSLARRAALCGVSVAVMVAVIAPWTYHNYRTYNTFMPLSVSTAVLWQGSPEFYHLMEQGYSLPKIYKIYLNEERNGGHDPFSIEGDRYFTDRAIAAIRAEPQVYAWYVVQKLAYFWIGHPANDWPNYSIFSLRAFLPELAPWQIASIGVTRLLPFIALAGLIVLRRHLWRFFPLLLFCGYFMFFHALTFAAVRYSEPLHPILLTIIAAAISQVLCYWNVRRSTLSLAQQKV